jgi:hypothetical protein
LLMIRFHLTARIEGLKNGAIMVFRTLLCKRRMTKRLTKTAA